MFRRTRALSVGARSRIKISPSRMRSSEVIEVKPDYRSEVVKVKKLSIFKSMEPYLFV
jgi:hypothetical protein